MDDLCPLCASPPQGEAYIDGQRYCHGPSQPGYVTCYRAAALSLPPGEHHLWALEPDPETGEVFPDVRRVTV